MMMVVVPAVAAVPVVVVPVVVLVAPAVARPDLPGPGLRRDRLPGPTARARRTRGRGERRRGDGGRREGRRVDRGPGGLRRRGRLRRPGRLRRHSGLRRPGRLRGGLGRGAGVVPVRRPGPRVPRPDARRHADPDLDVHVHVHVHADRHLSARPHRHRHVGLVAHADVHHRAVRVPAGVPGAGRGRPADQRAESDHAGRRPAQPRPPPGRRSPTAARRYPADLPTLGHGLHTPLGSSGEDGTGSGRPAAKERMEGAEQAERSNSVAAVTEGSAGATRSDQIRSGGRPALGGRPSVLRSNDLRADRLRLVLAVPRAQWRVCAISTFSSTPTASGTRMAAE